MAEKKKYYSVWRGRQKGVFDSWARCLAQVQGYPNAQYLAFDSLALAEEALQNTYEEARKSKLDPRQIRLLGEEAPILDAIAVDASCLGNPGPMEYRGVHIGERDEIFRKGPYPNGTNNVGEFLAIVEALAYLKKRGLCWPVYSDSRNAVDWVKAKHCRTKLPRNEKTDKIFELIERAEGWLQEHGSPNDVMIWKTEEWGETPADFGRK